MLNELKIGIIVADYDEYKPLAQFIESGEYKPYNFLNHIGHRFEVTGSKKHIQVISVLCGIGKVNAAAAAVKLADEGCRIIINYGLSGGISGVAKGDICVPEKYLEHDFDLTGIGYKPCEKPSQKYIYGSDKRLCDIFKKIIPSLKTGTAVSGDCFICDDERRIFLKNTFNASSCDMETAAIAYVCDAAGISFAALRRISDDAGADAGISYREMNTSNETCLNDAVIKCIHIIADSDIF